MDINEAESLLPQLDPAFERGCWVLDTSSTFLTQEFNQGVRALASDGAIACTCSVLDILAGESLRYVRNPGQRGFCMFFIEHPLALGREIAWTAIVHEAAHYLVDDSPTRDMPDEQQAVEQWWERGMESGRNKHDRRWATAAAHLAYRAMTHDVPLAVDELLESAGLNNGFLAGLRSELVSRADEPIETILGSRRPQASATIKRRRRTRYGILGGAPVEFLGDGGIATMPDQRGEGAKRYDTRRAFYDALDVQDFGMAPRY